MKIGVFIPIGSRGWLMSTTSPATCPTWELNRQVVQRAEHFGLDFALSMIKMRGLAGPSEFWVHALESFTLTAALAAVTNRIQLFASTAVLTLPPALAARMASTIDSVAPGRFGVNIVSGWQPKEYKQMGLWPGEAHFRRRYDYCAEYVQVMKDLWRDGRSDFKGDFFQMDDCVLSPRPSAMPQIVGAGMSERGLAFVAEHADYNFCLGATSGVVNDPSTFEPAVGRLRAAAARTGRKVGALLLLMVIAAETDEEAFARWELYKSGVDLEAWATREDQAGADKGAAAQSTAGRMLAADKTLPTNMTMLIGSYATIADHLDAIARIEGVEGVMLTFDDFESGIEAFGARIQPLMACRAGAKGA
ncbi:MAG TPA: pyrimidine utilization protein A [Beijerinckiaceae bacterium]